MIVAENGDLIGVAFGQVQSFESQDQWRSLSRVGVSAGHPAATTIAQRRGDLYILNAYIEQQPRDEYELIRVEFE